MGYTENKSIAFDGIGESVKTTAAGSRAIYEYVDLTTRVYKKAAASGRWLNRDTDFISDFGIPMTKAINRLIAANVDPRAIVGAEAVAMARARRANRDRSITIALADRAWHRLVADEVINVKGRTN